MKEILVYFFRGDIGVVGRLCGICCWEGTAILLPAAGTETPPPLCLATRSAAAVKINTGPGRLSPILRRCSLSQQQSRYVQYCCLVWCTFGVPILYDSCYIKIFCLVFFRYICNIDEIELQSIRMLVEYIYFILRVFRNTKNTDFRG